MKKPTVAVMIGFLLYFQILFNSPIPGKIIMSNKEVHNEGNVYEQVWRAYDKLPHNVKELLQDTNYRIYVVDLINGDENILGQTTYGLKIIEIRDFNYDVERTTLHECGHVLDDESNIFFISGTKEFKKIFEEEQVAFYDVVEDNYSYYVSDTKEYFAQAFAEYILQPEKLKLYTPKTYMFIKNCINNY